MFIECLPCADTTLGRDSGTGLPSWDQRAVALYEGVQCSEEGSQGDCLTWIRGECAHVTHAAAADGIRDRGAGGIAQRLCGCGSDLSKASSTEGEVESLLAEGLAFSCERCGTCEPHTVKRRDRGCRAAGAAAGVNAHHPAGPRAVTHDPNSCRPGAWGPWCHKQGHREKEPVLAQR